MNYSLIMLLWGVFYRLHQLRIVLTGKAMKSFLSFQGSRACFFSDLFTGESCPLRIPFDRLRAAVSPIPKSRKEQRPPASLSRNGFMALQVRLLPFADHRGKPPNSHLKKGYPFLIKRSALCNTHEPFSLSNVSSSYRVLGIQD
jgi:hypothetical protein